MKAVRIAALALPLLAGGAQAQDSGDSGGGRRAQPGAIVQRQRMEQRLRQGLWRIAKQRIGLTDAQMSRLTEVNHRFDARRRALNQAERAQRQILRAEILAQDSANQDRIASTLDRLLQLQRQRHEIAAEEQKEFATFMTPLQRAQYAALQEQLRRRAEELRGARAESGGAARKRVRADNRREGSPDER
jgi:hypothetical protein